MADYVISQITLVDGKTVELKDAVARATIAGGTKFLGVTTTEIEDGSEQTEIMIDDMEVSVSNGDIVARGNKEYIYAVIDLQWHELGDLSGLGDLALKDNVSASYTPAGSITRPNVDVTPTTTTITEINNPGSVVAGTANVPTVVTLPNWSVSMEGDNMTFTWNGGSVTPGVAGTPTNVTLPTSKTTNVLTGVTAELDEDPAFTGNPSVIVSY